MSSELKELLSMWKRTLPSVGPMQPKTNSGLSYENFLSFRIGQPALDQCRDLS